MKFLSYKKYQYWLVSLLVICVGFSSCKSHKKARVEGSVIVEDVIEIKPHKGKKEKSVGDKLAKESLTWIGTPYGYGRSDKGVATDCSGMVLKVYEKVTEIKLPRNSAEQAAFCDDIDEGEVESGDLVFFATGKDKHKVSHVGIMLNRVEFVHASGSKGVIQSEMTTPYYKRNFVKYGRVPGK